MAVEEIELDLPTTSGFELPDAVASYLEEANRRIDVLFDTERNKRTPKFIPSDPELLYAALAEVTERDLPLGRVYCEWGSGLGLGTCMAALLGYEAYGIEIEPTLVDASRALAEDSGIDARIIEGSYIPEGFESYGGMGGEELVRPEHFFGGDGEFFAPSYEGMPYTTDEIDLFFVYPWPTEQEFMLQLFDALAAEGAVFLAYYGDGEICCYRKTGEDFE
ncbi:MAG: hypothetical protein KDN22_27035 [Verrucomicrobiae bacterium]|nr:hypothetical protein [Verrucomicrobiae bacterium]